MKLINPAGTSEGINVHGLHLATGTTNPDAQEGYEIIRNKPHPYNLLHQALKEAWLEVPQGGDLNEDLILYSREEEEPGRKVRMYVEPMRVGTIAEAIDLKRVIPLSGPVDVPLLGSLIKMEKGNWVGSGSGSPGKGGWLGAGIGAARALCSHQEIIPNDFHLGRTQLLFSGTIVFDPALGICIPVMAKEDGAWVIRHRDILDQVIPGVDLHMWWW